jgi:hypothetical protein
MKTFALISFLSVLSTVPMARAQTSSDTITISAPERRIEAPSHVYRMWDDEFADFKRVYFLSDGKTLSLYSKGKRMYAEVDGQATHEIVATTPNTFVALDRKLKMRIDLVSDDEARGELLMAVPAQPVAGNTEPGEKLVAVVFH